MIVWNGMDPAAFTQFQSPIKPDLVLDEVNERTSRWSVLMISAKGSPFTTSLAHFRASSGMLNAFRCRGAIRRETDRVEGWMDGVGHNVNKRTCGCGRQYFITSRVSSLRR